MPPESWIFCAGMACGSTISMMCVWYVHSKISNLDRW
jgi:hypothetical protein